MTEPQYLTVGRVLRPHGVRGELLLEVLTDFPDTLIGQTVYFAPGEGTPPDSPPGLAGAARRQAQVASIRWHRGRLLIHLGGCGDRETADAYRGSLIQIEAGQAQPLADGQYYHHQIVGLRAIGDEGQTLGEVTGVLETGANDVYVVQTSAGGELLLPAISSVVRKIDLEAGEMFVHLLDGLE